MQVTRHERDFSQEDRRAEGSMVRRAFGAQRGISFGGGSANPPFSSALPSALLSSCEIQGLEPTCGQRVVRKALGPPATQRLTSGFGAWNVGGPTGQECPRLRVISTALARVRLDNRNRRRPSSYRDWRRLALAPRRLPVDRLSPPARLLRYSRHRPWRWSPRRAKPHRLLLGHSSRRPHYRQWR